MIILGVDGGATKTEACIVRDGRVVGFSRGGPSNHQVVGMEGALSEIVTVIDMAFTEAGLEGDSLDNAVLGLAGADFPQDVSRITERLSVYFGSRPFRIVNDAEVALYAGTDKGWGIVAVAGTGGNVLGRTADGRVRQVGGLGYEYGDWGSGADVAKAVLHHAFRSAERRGRPTVLEQQVLDLFGRKNYEELSWAMYDHQIPVMAFLALVPLCFQAALDKDVVASHILDRQGQSIGESIVGCARLLHLDRGPVDVVLAGSLWLGVAPHLKDSVSRVLKDELPEARVLITEFRPVAGALFMAATHTGPLAVLREDLRLDARLRGVE